MKRRKTYASINKLLLAGCTGLFIFALAQATPKIVLLNSAELWQRADFLITNVPGVSNPFDPDVIRVDAMFTLPSGRTMNVPAFWYQNYQRSLLGGYEQLLPNGAPEWRLRFTPPESGNYSLALTIQTNGRLYETVSTTNFSVPVAVAPPGSGYVRVASNKQYFETSDGQALRLIGENADWPTTGQGTYQYDTWFPHMKAAGENYTRLMITPWSFGLETYTNTLTNYRLDQAWQLDYVFQLAEQEEMYVLLCLNIHLMLQPVPDYWGNDNYWQSNPYNAANGGPCVTQDDFFINATARVIFQKKLRYLVARYGYSTKLLAWQLWSEVDNEYSYLNSTNVPPWHAVMSDWLHTNDPCSHLVTTSLTGGSDRPEIWSLPQLDFACYHSYSEPFPAARLNAVAQSYHQHYNKPVIIDEFGTSWAVWNRTNDVYLRGFRQGLWGGALGGSVGTAMSWWYDSIDAENDYSDYAGLGLILNRTGWGNGVWTNINFQTSGPAPTTVGNLVPGGQPFNVTLIPGGTWGASVSGRLAVPNSEAAQFAGINLNSFILGSWFPTSAEPFALSAWFTNNARLVMHLNSVSESAGLGVRVDGNLLWSTNPPNLDGLNDVNNEYNLDIPIALPSGKHLVEITNTAPGWSYLDWVRLEQVLPASYAGNWVAGLDAIGLQGAHESLLYLLAPGVAFNGSDTNATFPMLHGRVVVLTNWPAGRFYAEWYDTATGTNMGFTQGFTTNGGLVLSLPDFSEDLTGIIYPPPAFSFPGLEQPGMFQGIFNSEFGGQYWIEKSDNLSNWSAFLAVTNVQGSWPFTDPGARTNAREFFRARK